MSGIYKINNGLAPSLMNFPFLFRNNKVNSRNFRVFSTDLRKMVNYELETVAYSAPTIWIKLPSEYKWQVLWTKEGRFKILHLVAF